MPRLLKLKDVYKKQKIINKERYGNPVQIQDASTDNRTSMYNSTSWKHTRNTFIQFHPVCELCLLRGITKPAEQIHHAIKFHEQWTNDLRWKLLTDTDNLMALCTDHHNYIHKNQELLDDNQKAYIKQKKDYVSNKYLQNNIIINYTSDINTKVYQK